ncbi:hypothetical protein N431DRAFT_426971 [Stipitochalara longipes BDJ]|nr:hypothetical protein N431DRAFT_426971 [Stipitochalara longipes BDJ]
MNAYDEWSVWEDVYTGMLAPVIFAHCSWVLSWRSAPITSGHLGYPVPCALQAGCFWKLS